MLVFLCSRVCKLTCCLVSNAAWAPRLTALQINSAVLMLRESWSASPVLNPVYVLICSPPLIYFSSLIGAFRRHQLSLGNSYSYLITRTRTRRQKAESSLATAMSVGYPTYTFFYRDSAKREFFFLLCYDVAFHTHKTLVPNRPSSCTDPKDLSGLTGAMPDDSHTAVFPQPQN